jgi:outer membrane protein, heavy metal efflux system
MYRNDVQLKSHPLSKAYRNVFSAWVVAIFLLTGCASTVPYHSFDYVSEEIEKNIGAVITPEPVYGEQQIPDGISLEDGLTEQEAVAIALWNNVAFQADLAQLGVSRAEVLKAGLFQNPNFTMLFPIGTKQLESWLLLPLSEFKMRPHRLEVARLNASKVADNLIQNGLDLARDTQLAFANLFQAEKTFALLTEQAQLDSKIADIAKKQFQLGDISELEAYRKAIDAMNVLDQKNRMGHDVQVFRHRLISLLGIESTEDFKLVPETISSPDEDIKTLLETAYASRPDLRIVELEIESAGKQIGWEEDKVINYIGILDANATNVEVGPGVQLDIPIFNQNEGGIARAQAELDVAGKKYLAVREKIKLTVLESHTQFLSAREGFELVTNEILPQQEKRLNISRHALENGEISFLSNLEVERDWILAKVREIVALADLRRTTAQLGHSIGRPVNLMKDSAS